MSYNSRRYDDEEDILEELGRGIISLGKSLGQGVILAAQAIDKALDDEEPEGKLPFRRKCSNMQGFGNSGMSNNGSNYNNSNNRSTGISDYNYNGGDSPYSNYGKNKNKNKHSSTSWKDIDDNLGFGSDASDNSDSSDEYTTKKKKKKKKKKKSKKKKKKTKKLLTTEVEENSDTDDIEENDLDEFGNFDNDFGDFDDAEEEEDSENQKKKAKKKKSKKKKKKKKAKKKKSKWDSEDEEEEEEEGDYEPVVKKSKSKEVKSNKSNEEEWGTFDHNFGDFEDFAFPSAPGTKPQTPKKEDAPIQQQAPPPDLLRLTSSTTIQNTPEKNNDLLNIFGESAAYTSAQNTSPNPWADESHSWPEASPSLPATNSHPPTYKSPDDILDSQNKTQKACLDLHQFQTEETFLFAKTQTKKILSFEEFTNPNQQPTTNQKLSMNQLQNINMKSNMNLKTKDTKKDALDLLLNF